MINRSEIVGGGVSESSAHISNAQKEFWNYMNEAQSAYRSMLGKPAASNLENESKVPGSGSKNRLTDEARVNLTLNHDWSQIKNESYKLFVGSNKSNLDEFGLPKFNRLEDRTNNLRALEQKSRNDDALYITRSAFDEEDAVHQRQSAIKMLNLRIGGLTSVEDRKTMTALHTSLINGDEKGFSSALQRFKSDPNRLEKFVDELQKNLDTLAGTVASQIYNGRVLVYDRSGNHAVAFNPADGSSTLRAISINGDGSVALEQGEIISPSLNISMRQLGQYLARRIASPWFNSITGEYPWTDRVTPHSAPIEPPNNLKIQTAPIADQPQPVCVPKMPAQQYPVKDPASRRVPE